MKSVDYKSIRNRPRFKIKLEKNEEKIYLALKKVFEQNKETLSGFLHKDIALFYVTNTHKKYWAPQLELRWEVDEDDPNSFHLRGLYGPRPAIWTFFIFLYILGFTLLGFFGMLWFVQYRIHLNSDLNLWAWLGLLLIILTYIASWVGKRKAKKELAILKNFMEKALEELHVS